MKRIKSIGSYFFIAASFIVMVPDCLRGQPEAWTWLHRKVFNQQELTENQQKKEISFYKQQCNPFTQLVFSWNAFREQDGYFSFWVKVHNKKTDRWGSWHKMAEWGNGVQRSFASKKDDARCCYVHVRLECPEEYADAFRIKILSHDNADLSLVKSFAVSLSDYTKFKSESVDKKRMRLLPSVRIAAVPKKAQLSLDHPRNNHLCSPTSCSMVTSFLTGQEIDPVDFAQNAFDAGLNAYGSWPFNTAHAFERCQGAVWFAPARFNEFKELHHQLQRGIPVIVSVRGRIDGAPKSYDSGHLLVVVGWDAHKQTVICHDPAFDRADKIVKQYPVKSFLSAWERSHRLAYLAEPITGI